MEDVSGSEGPGRASAGRFPARAVVVIAGSAAAVAGADRVDAAGIVTVRAAARAAAPGGDHLQVVLDPAGGRLLGDPDLLEEALAAILANAIQATQEGGTVAVTTERRGDCLGVLVKDTGPGMAPEEVERALDPFFTTRGVGEGMGLGLSIAYSIIRRHGGKMTLESARGEGTTVRITLPAEPACDASRA